MSGVMTSWIDTVAIDVPAVEPENVTIICPLGGTTVATTFTAKVDYSTPDTFVVGCWLIATGTSCKDVPNGKMTRGLATGSPPSGENDFAFSVLPCTYDLKARGDISATVTNANITVTAGATDPCVHLSIATSPSEYSSLK